MNSSHVRLARNTALSLAGIGLLGGSRLILNVVVGRRFGAEALGEVTIAINAAMFATLLVAGGWQAASARYIAASLGAGAVAQAGGIFRRSLAHNSAGGVVIAAGAAAALAWEGRIPLRDAVIAGAVALSYNAYQHLKAATYGYGLVPVYLAHETASSGLMLVGLAVVAAADARAWVLVPVAGGYACYAALALGRLRGESAGAAAPDPTLWREVKGFTILAVIGTLASAGFLNLSAVFAGRHGTAQAGVFAAALAVVLPVYFFPRALSLAMFPAIAYLHGRGDDVRRTLEASGPALAALLVVPVGVAAIGARYVLRVLFGASYEPGAEVLAIMLAATYLSVVQIPWVTALSGTERRWYKVPVLASVAGFAIGLVLWTSVAQDVRGVAWGYLIGSVPQALVPIAFAARTFGVRIASAGVRAGAAWVVVVFARAWSDGRGWWPTFAACAAFAAIAVALFPREWRGAIGQVRRRQSGSAEPISAPPSTQK